MRYIFLILTTCMALAAFKLNAQVTNTVALVSNQKNYESISQKQKTAAWILLGGGAAATVTGFAIGSNHLWEDIYEGKERMTGEAFIYTGLVAMAASVPFFILSKKNARKAALTFSRERIPSIKGTNLEYQNIPSIKLKITIP